jgi:alpha-mannosidase
MNWMWPWPETVAVTNDTFTTVLKLMDEFPDFRFTQSQASVYALTKKYNPELFEQIRKRVAERRWEVAAVHWVEGDKNLASGEALAHHLLYTRQFVKEHFGLEPEDSAIDWEPDTFGHAETMPAIVARAGVRHYYMCRGGSFEKPPVFQWEAPDGSRVLVNYETPGT